MKKPIKRKVIGKEIKKVQVRTPEKLTEKIQESMPEKAADFSLRPLHDRVLLKEIETAGERTVSGIIVPESVDKNPDAKKAKVIAVGAGKYDSGDLVPMSVSVGDTVLYQWGEKVTIGREEYTIVRDQDILAIVE